MHVAKIGFIALAGCAGSVPAGLQPSSDEEVWLSLRTAGTQKYRCEEQQEPPGLYQWQLESEDAGLFLGDAKIGQHTDFIWEAVDGSKVEAKPMVTAPGLKPDAIPWVLFSVTLRSRDGCFHPVTSIQRVDTASGKAPFAGCNKDNDGKEVSVDFRAVYNLFAPKTSKKISCTAEPHRERTLDGP
jgi:hypothetical protein